MPPDSGVAITGVPHASASSATFGRPSQREGTSIASAPAKEGQGAGSKPANRIRSAAPRARARSCSAARSGPSPNRHSLSSASLVREHIDQPVEPFYVGQPSGRDESSAGAGFTTEAAVRTQAHAVDWVREHADPARWQRRNFRCHFLGHRPVLTQHQIGGRVEQTDRRAA